MNNEGKEKIAKLMHVFIEGIAAGIYESVYDIERDAKEYLAMEKVVDKLSNWKETDTVEDLAKLFDGVVSSAHVREHASKEKEEWNKIKEMPNVADDIETFLVDAWDESKKIGETNAKE